MSLVKGKKQVPILFGYSFPTGSTEQRLFGTSGSGAGGRGGKDEDPQTRTDFRPAGEFPILRLLIQPLLGQGEGITSYESRPIPPFLLPFSLNTIVPGRRREANRDAGNQRRR